ncbi:hypothetical protein AB6A40_010993 [Gnathostoma spinigerum]|uniref:EB domain-containing protein n=1 Tax=Gnathostoma spinigerum TaxID=75299 RepID=A0ABD6EWF5_9BILA
MCRPMARPGEACYGDPQCYDGSACSSDYRCTCPRGLNNIYSYCRKLSFLEPCNQALQVNVQGVCQPLVSPSGRCISSKQCLSMSECIGGICRCPQGTNLINGYCVRYTGCATNQSFLAIV